jgi:hypothetical protein
MSLQTIQYNQCTAIQSVAGCKATSHAAFWIVLAGVSAGIGPSSQMTSGRNCAALEYCWARPRRLTPALPGNISLGTWAGHLVGHLATDTSAKWPST